MTNADVTATNGAPKGGSGKTLAVGLDADPQSLNSIWLLYSKHMYLFLLPPLLFSSSLLYFRPVLPTRCTEREGEGEGEVEKGS